MIPRGRDLISRVPGQISGCRRRSHGSPHRLKGEVFSPDGLPGRLGTSICRPRPRAAASLLDRISAESAGARPPHVLYLASDFPAATGKATRNNYDPPLYVRPIIINILGRQIGNVITPVYVPEHDVSYY